MMGFDPMMQFIHEEDVARVLLLTLERAARGVYNVVGPGAVPLHVAIRETGGSRSPCPSRSRGRSCSGSSSSVCIRFRRARSISSSIRARVSDRRLRATTGFEPQMEPARHLRAIAGRARPGDGLTAAAERRRLSDQPANEGIVDATLEALVRTLAFVLPGAIGELEEDVDARLARIPTELNEYGYDPWGMNPRTLRAPCSSPPCSTATTSASRRTASRTSRRAACC